MKKRLIKKLLKLTPIFASLVPIALVYACGEDSQDETEKVAQANQEKTRILALGGNKSIMVDNEKLPKADNLEFSENVALRFGIAGFLRNNDFKYTYSHPEIVEDQTFPLQITVTFKDVKSTNEQSLDVKLEGVNDYNSSRISVAQSALMQVNQTIYSQLDFSTIVYLDQIVWNSESAINDLGIANSDELDINDLTIKFTKMRGFRVNYIVSKAKGTPAEFDVEFSQFQTYSQLEVDFEQSKLSAISAPNAVTTISPSWPRTASGNFTLEKAKEWGVINFLPTPGFTYSYAHDLIDDNGSYVIAIRAKAGSTFAQSTKTISVTVNGFYPRQVQAVKNMLEAIRGSSLTISRFVDLEIKDQDFNLIKTRLGFGDVQIAYNVTVIVNKLRGDTIVSYQITRGNVKENTSQNIDQFSIDFELFRQRALDTYSTTLTYDNFKSKQILRSVLTKEHATQLGVNYDLIIDNLGTEIKMDIQKSLDSAEVTFFVMDKNDTIKYQFSTLFVVFSDTNKRYDHIPTTFNLTNEATSYGIEGSHFVKISDATLNSIKLDLVRQFLKQYFDGRSNYFLQGTISNIITDRQSAQVWNPELGIYNLTFDLQFTNLAVRNITFSATGIV